MQGLMQDCQLALPLIFEGIEGRFAHKTILTRQSGEKYSITYGEFAARVRRLATVLNTLGMSSDARVGTFAWNSQRHLELYMAVPLTGRVLHTINHRLFSEQLIYIMREAENEVIFVDRSLLAVVYDSISKCPTIQHIIVMEDGTNNPIPSDPRILDYEDLMAQAEPRVGPFVIEDERRAAGLCFTSGTTSDPKGVLYDHRSVILHALLLQTADSYALSELDVVAPIAPMFHVNAWGLPYAALMCGATLSLVGADTAPPMIVSQFEQDGVTVSNAVATVWQSLIPELEKRQITTIRLLVCGGGSTPISLSQRYLTAVGIPLSGSWGMTETSPVVTLAKIRSDDRYSNDNELVQIMSQPGVNAPLTSFRIRRDDKVNTHPNPEFVGELEIAGPTIAKSYYKQPNNSSFTEDGWLRTGDVALIDERGRLKILDRVKDLIKSGGEWISSQELEKALAQHPEIQEVAIIGRPDEKWSERPVAFVVLNSNIYIKDDDLKVFLSSRVAKWWIPDDYYYVDNIPKTATGKISKIHLRKILLDI